MNQSLDLKTHNLQMRPARADDAPLLHAILSAAFEEYRGLLDPPAGVLHETVDTIREKLQQGAFIIALLGDVPAGCVFYQPANSYLYLGRLAVLPQFRKQGVARALIDFIEQQAVIRQLPRVQLGVRTALPHLQAFYTQLGYHPVRYGTHEGYTQPTYVIMEKELIP